MVRMLICYLAIYLNSRLLSVHLSGFIDEPQLLVLHISFFLILVYALKLERTCCNWKFRLKWLIFLFLLMIFHVSLLNHLLFFQPANQEILLSIQRKVSVICFYLFLLNAGILEEYFYRKLLWNNFQIGILQIGVTSILFSLSHNPEQFSSFFIYFGMGICLGIMKSRTDLLGSILLHAIWNTFVFVTT